jgi:DNA repair exonuclease SbcCD ATPase subunit
MRLILENFRCYRGIHRFDFVKDGITLVSGSSGAGKTTLLIALHFVITGNSPPKVITDGCDSCKVTLEIPEMTIFRTRRPNRVVVVGLGLEDDLAQQYIDRHFGKYFDITSYIQQQYQKTFLYQSPSEKLEILEKLCFDETSVQPEELKKNCMVLFKQLNSEHISLKSRHSTLSEQAVPLDCPVRIEPPDPTHYENLVKSLEKIKESQHTCYTQLSNQSKREEYEKSIEKLQNELDLIEHCDYSESQLNEQLYHLKELENLTTKETWIKYPKEECLTMISDYVRDIDYHKEHIELTRKIKEQSQIETQIHSLENKKKSIENMSEGIYDCPSCQTTLSLMNRKLVITKPTVEQLSTEEKNKKIQNIIDQLELLQPKIKSLGHYRERQEEIDKQIDLTEDLSELEADYKWIVDYYEMNKKIETQNTLKLERKEKICNQMIQGLDSNQCTQWLKNVQQKNHLEKKIQYLQDQLNCLDVMSEKLDIHELEQTKKQIEDDISKHKEHMHAYEMYNFHYERYTKYTQIKEEIQELSKKIQVLEKRMGAVSEFKQLILKTESEIIDQKTREISSLVNAYCAQIFNEPITVELKTTKKTSTQNDKVQIQLEVYYKNMKCEPSLLSGGEQARLNLAFVLAFANVFQSRLLMLDECTSNLDQELVQIVVDQIETTGIPKVILIAHQVVEGNFKQILQI